MSERRPGSREWCRRFRPPTRGYRHLIDQFRCGVPHPPSHEGLQEAEANTILISEVISA